MVVVVGIVRVSFGFEKKQEANYRFGASRKYRGSGTSENRLVKKKEEVIIRSTIGKDCIG